MSNYAATSWIRPAWPRFARLSGLAVIGCVCGMLFAAPVAALTDQAEGAGYGGDAGWLHVTVQGADVLVRGEGFMAGSEVIVAAGSLELSVVADDLGAIDTLIPAQPVSTVENAGVTAQGLAADGTEREIVSDPHADQSTPVTTTAAAGALGGVTALGLGRRRVGREGRSIPPHMLPDEPTD